MLPCNMLLHLAHGKASQGLRRNVRRKVFAADIPSSQGLRRKVRHKVVARFRHKVCRKVSQGLIARFFGGV